MLFVFVFVFELVDVELVGLEVGVINGLVGTAALAVATDVYIPPPLTAAVKNVPVLLHAMDCQLA